MRYDLPDFTDPILKHTLHVQNEKSQTRDTAQHDGKISLIRNVYLKIHDKFKQYLFYKTISLEASHKTFRE